jgi:hypothetical protein
MCLQKDMVFRRRRHLWDESQYSLGKFRQGLNSVYIYFSVPLYVKKNIIIRFDIRTLMLMVRSSEQEICDQAKSRDLAMERRRRRRRVCVTQDRKSIKHSNLLN